MKSATPRRTFSNRPNRISRIVESLVNFSHTGSRSGEVTLAPGNLADCVDEAIHLLALDRQAKPVQFDNQLRPGTGGDGRQPAPAAGLR